MAIIEETIENSKGKFIKRYSDQHYYIERDGVDYEEAIDPYDLREERIYIETDEPIEEEIIEESDDEEINIAEGDNIND